MADQEREELMFIIDWLAREVARDYGEEGPEAPIEWARKAWQEGRQGDQVMSSGHTIDISGLTCPVCPHTNGEHDSAGNCRACVCHRQLWVTLIGGGKEIRG